MPYDLDLSGSDLDASHIVHNQKGVIPIDLEQNPIGNSTDTIDAVEIISKLAYKDIKPEPHQLTVPQWLLWYRLRDVYRECINNPKAGAEQKQKQVSQYEQDRADWVRTKEVHEYMSDYWKRIEPSASKYALEQTVESANEFFEAVYGVPVRAKLEQIEKGANES